LMRLEEFDFVLPQELIAQQPVQPRDTCRLMVVKRKEGVFEHCLFKNLVEYVSVGDVLVINDTKVVPARFYAKKETGGKVEILFLGKENLFWKVLLNPSRRVREGQLLFLDERRENGFRVIKRDAEGIWWLEPLFSLAEEEVFEKFGKTPLPPYIKAGDVPLSSYQTVYARVPGSVAAPTAGLHFTPELLDVLRSKGVEIAYITLHVGLGTFKPIKSKNILEHRMHSETYSIAPEEALKIETARKRGQRIIACGTTVVRALEATQLKFGEIRGCQEETDLFIYPGFQFKVVNAMITNFHLPRSTLFVLVCAFGGKELMQKAYQEAIAQRYRFYSFGDAMLIL